MQQFETFLFYLFGASSPLSIFAINLTLSLFVLLCFYKIFIKKLKFELSIIVFFLFVFSQILSALFSDNVASSLKGVKDFWALSAGFLAGYSLLSETKKNFDRFKVFISVSTFLAFTMALIQFFFGTDFQKQRLFSQSGIASMPSKGFFTHHLTFAAVMGIVFLLFLADFLIKKITFFSYIALFSSFFGLILSQSRGYFLTLILTVALLLFKNQKRILTLFILFSLIFAALFLFLSPSHIKEKAYSLFSLKNGSFAERVYLWESGLKMFLRKPILGYGPNQYQNYSETFREVYEKKVVYPDDVGFRTKCHTHNTYLMILIESGIIGFAMFIFFLIVILKSILSLEQEIKFPFLASFVFFLLGGLFEYNLGDAEVVSLFSFLMGLSIAIKRSNDF